MLVALNLDVLAEIISYLTTKQALRISTTCRMVHDLAIPVALRQVVLKDKTCCQLNQFIDFLLTAVDQRPRLIRRLELHGDISPYPPLRSRAARKKQRLNEIGLVVVLAQARNLQTLVLEWSDDLFRQYPFVMNAFSNLQCLRVIQLSDIGGYATRALCATRSAPCTLVLDDECGKSSDCKLHLSSMLLASITSFSVRYIPPARILPREIAFPNVRDLVWSHCEISLDLLVKAFPSVTSLNISDNKYRNHRLWRSLDYLTGSLDDLDEVLSKAAIQGGVRFVNVNEDTPVDVDSWDFIARIISSSSPSNLWLPLEPKDNLDVPEYFVATARRLRCLKIIVNEYEAVSTHSWFVSMQV